MTQQAKKLFIEIASGEESYYFTVAEALQLLKEESDRVAREKREDELPFIFGFRFMTDEDFAELSENPDRPAITPAPAQGVEEAILALQKAIQMAEHDSEDPLATSWPEQTGVLISLSDAKKLLTGSRWQQGQEYPSAHGHAPLSNVQKAPESAVVGSMPAPTMDMNEIEELRRWKAEALKVMPDFQAIGKALGVPIGETIHDKILPGIEKLKERASAPTIGARWVREEIEKRISYLKKTDAEVCKERWDMTQPEFKRRVARDTSNFLTERRHELEDLLKLIPADESPFPTREEAIKWVDEKYDKRALAHIAAPYALAMYDWITSQLKDK